MRKVSRDTVEVEDRKKGIGNFKASDRGLKDDDELWREIEQHGATTPSRSNSMKILYRREHLHEVESIMLNSVEAFFIE